MSVLDNRHQGTGNILENNTKTCIPQLNPISLKEAFSFSLLSVLGGKPWERREKRASQWTARGM